MKEKKSILNNVFFVATMDFLINSGMIFIINLLSIPMYIYNTKNPGSNSEFRTYLVYYYLFILYILVFLIFMRCTDRRTLKIFSMSTPGKRIRNVFCGLLIGIFVNSLLCILVYVSGSVQHCLLGFSWRLLVLLPGTFLQCTAEEVALRGFVPAYLEGRYRWYIIAPVIGVLFTLHHIENMINWGINYLFCLNVFLLGFAFYLLFKLTRSFWVCCGFHTGWNLTQMFIFGLPNSGQTSELGIFKGSDAVKTFFFDPVYGNEGSLMCTVLGVCLLIILLLLIKKRSTEGLNLLDTVTLSAADA